MTLKSFHTNFNRTNLHHAIPVAERICKVIAYLLNYSLNLGIGLRTLPNAYLSFGNCLKIHFNAFNCGWIIRPDQLSFYRHTSSYVGLKAFPACFSYTTLAYSALISRKIMCRTRTSWQTYCYQTYCCETWSLCRPTLNHKALAIYNHAIWQVSYNHSWRNLSQRHITVADIITVHRLGYLFVCLEEPIILC